MSNYTPATLAREWGCSERRILKLISEEKLTAFRLGEKLLRIKPEEVARYQAANIVADLREPTDFRFTVYFVKCGAYVKIGIASDLEKRVASLRTGIPYDVELLASIPANPSTEREMHRRFAALRHRGEWFRYEGDLVDYVKGLAQNG